MKTAKIKIDGKWTIHHPGILQPFDSALCGQDLIGDESLGWGIAEESTQRITCSDCIRIIEACWQVKKTDISKPK